ncbi:hypothetical protein H6G97_20290 [Nostoc flagelliforme FACHB-838]|uniref:PEP-CTERM sorting domain-containing protein n=1 Tax=Nostoc flagelliforme FACHB-838 TaxID=2692904 RepID=A0ABR8DSK0_9NOSO|nr:hypothetical protein [Nostoc flagelliforme]MBD2531807.1 hypothetical protein [Nostoc flagelliforme FACHB-838]
MAFNTLVLSSLLALQILPPLPSENSANRIDFFGDINENEGNVGFSSLDPSAPDYGHIEISKNSLGFNSSYYVTGREGSPEPFNQAVKSGSMTGINGYNNFSNYLTSNGIAFKDIGFGFSQKSDRSFTQTWNLGDDILGKDWYGSPDSTVEELIYKANPDNVDFSLFYQTTKIVDFSYSDIFVAADEGPTISFEDNNFFVFTNPVTARKEADLALLENSLADAFLSDVASLGGEVRVIWNSAGAPESFDFITTDKYGIQYFSIPGSIQAVAKPVPESSYIPGILVLGFIGGVCFRKNRKQNEPIVKLAGKICTGK